MDIKSGARPKNVTSSASGVVVKLTPAPGFALDNWWRVIGTGQVDQDTNGIPDIIFYTAGGYTGGMGSLGVFFMGGSDGSLQLSSKVLDGLPLGLRPVGVADFDGDTQWFRFSDCG